MQILEAVLCHPLIDLYVEIQYLLLYRKNNVHKAHLLHNFCELKKVQPRQDSAKNSAFDVVEQSSFTCWVQAIKLFMAIISIRALAPINLAGHELLTFPRCHSLPYTALSTLW